MLSRLLRRIRPRSVYDVFAVLAFFIAVGTGGAYAANTIRSTDIVDGEVKTADVANQNLTGGDIKDGSITTFDLTDGVGVVGADVADGSLTAKDVGENSFVSFAASIPPMPANSCTTDPVTGVAAQGDHMLLTASNTDSAPQLTYSIEYLANSQNADLKICNPTNVTVDDSHITHFNLLVFQH